jgi:hypothetical protein
MVIEIPRSFLIREPWTTVTVGGVHNTRPMVVSISSALKEGHALIEKLNASDECIDTFRVVDGAGPCYEFQGRASVEHDQLMVEVEGELKFLR